MIQDISIMILPANKGRAVVILNNSNYQLKSEELINDTHRYKRLKNDPTNIYCKQILEVIKPFKESGISHWKHRHIYLMSTESPTFYRLPIAKIYKLPCPLRPIVATRDVITYNKQGI